MSDSGAADSVIRAFEVQKDIEKVRPNNAFISERLKQVRRTLKTATRSRTIPAHSSYWLMMPCAEHLKPC